MGRVLVVDDDCNLNALVALTLKNAGYSVASADNGESGWEALRVDTFDLLITDHSMPKLNGLDLLRRIRANSVNLPAILMSADMPREVGDIIELVAPGGAIHKPFAMKDLLVKVGTVFDNVQSITTDALPRRPRALEPSGTVQRASLHRAAQAKLIGLARNLLARESSSKRSGDNSPTILRVFDKIRKPIQNLAGETGFRSILARALILAKADVVWLWPVKISANGSFECLGLAEEGLTPAEISRGETAIVAQMLGLLFTFLGESMTRALLQEAQLEDESRI